MTEATVTRFAVEIDTQLAETYDRQMRVEQEVSRALDTLHHHAKDRKDSPRRGVPARWQKTEAEVRAFVPTFTLYAQDHAAAIVRLDRARERLHQIEAEIAALDAQYTGWSRFFLVPGGHIHRSTRCSTCHPTTLFGWLPLLSGLTEADAVAEHGPLLCSVCFPLAPVEWTVGPQSSKTYCEGSNTRPEGFGSPQMTWTGRQNYLPCPSCGKYVAVTKYGEVRKHQPATEAN